MKGGEGGGALPAVITNTLATFEQYLWLRHDRLRCKQVADESGNEPEREHPKQDINEWSPEQESEHSPRHPKHEGNDLSCDGQSGPIDALEVLIHDRRSGGYAPPSAPPTIRFKKHGPTVRAFLLPAQREVQSRPGRCDSFRAPFPSRIG
jgi:hypothetical protein